jgi:MFS family permease
MGVVQSLAALARILGPPCGGWLYKVFFPAAPFYLASVFGIFGLILIVISNKSASANAGIASSN